MREDKVPLMSFLNTAEKERFVRSFVGRKVRVVAGMTVARVSYGTVERVQAVTWGVGHAWLWCSDRNTPIDVTWLQAIEEVPPAPQLPLLV